MYVCIYIYIYVYIYIYIYMCVCVCVCVIQYNYMSFSSRIRPTFGSFAYFNSVSRTLIFQVKGILSNIILEYLYDCVHTLSSPSYSNQDSITGQRTNK